MKVCIVGSDARAHVLSSVMSQQGHEVVVSPGRHGIPNSVPEQPTQIEADLFVISAEQLLVDGLADTLRAQGKNVFGPGQAGALLEGSKKWMKEVVDEAGVPTARWVGGTRDGIDVIYAFIEECNGNVAVKTDGLAAGKGVKVCSSVEEAKLDVLEKLTGEAFGSAGRTVVVEELLADLQNPNNPEYYELSVFVATDGNKRAALFETAQDFKRLRNHDQGPNTGGMGSYSPVPGVSREQLEEIYKTCIEPVMWRLSAMGIDYRGFLYCGIMMTPEGPKVLEFNIRFGDPEAQSVLPRVKPDLAQVLYECAIGDLQSQLEFTDDGTVTVVLAVEGYAEWDKPQSGDVITGVEKALELEGVSVFCAGTGQDDDGNTITAGGRVLSVVGRGQDLKQARRRAYSAVERIDWNGVQYRIDIGPNE